MIYTDLAKFDRRLFIVFTAENRCKLRRKGGSVTIKENLFLTL